MYKVNEIVSKCLLAWDKFVSQGHLRQPNYTCCACKERIHKFKETEDSR